MICSELGEAGWLAKGRVSHRDWGPDCWSDSMVWGRKLVKEMADGAYFGPIILSYLMLESSNWPLFA
eukprot:531148-Pelagomonas_calceolata.AAC.7